MVAQVGAIELDRISSLQRKLGAVAVGVTTTLPDHDSRLVVVRVDVNAIASRPVDRERQRRGGDFDFLPGVQAADAQVDRALGHLDLHQLVVQRQDFEAGFRPDAYRGAAHLDLRPGASLGPDPVAGDQRTIARNVEPVILAGWRVADVALDVAEARHTPRRIGGRGVCDEGRAEHSHRQQTQ